MEFSLKKQIFFVLLFVAVLVFQIAITKYLPKFPDISLLLIIFGGIYFFGNELLFLTALVSFFRSFFSPETLVIDAVLMPCLCVIAYLFSKMFNRQNVLFQMIITGVSFLLLISIHALFFNITTGSQLSVITLISASGKKIFITSMASPILFMFFREYFRIKW